MSIHTLPIKSSGSPLDVRDQWSPPSIVLYTPPSLAGPPLTIVHGLRCARQAPAYSSFGFDQLIAIDTAPVCSLRKSTFCHVAPPSFVRYTPRSGPQPNGLPIAATYAISGFLG